MVVLTAKLVSRFGPELGLKWKTWAKLNNSTLDEENCPYEILPSSVPVAIPSAVAIELGISPNITRNLYFCLKCLIKNWVT